MRCATPIVELRQTIESRVSAISPFVDRLMRFLAPLVEYFRSDDEDPFGIEIAVREAVANAVVHGNGQDPGKRVHVLCRCTLEGDLLLTVGDEGRGFNLSAVPDPTAPENLLETHGRGIRLMQTFMDEVRFEAGGAVVHLIKHLRAQLR